MKRDGFSTCNFMRKLEMDPGSAVKGLAGGNLMMFVLFLANKVARATNWRWENVGRAICKEHEVSLFTWSLLIYSACPLSSRHSSCKECVRGGKGNVMRLPSPESPLSGWMFEYRGRHHWQLLMNLLYLGCGYSRKRGKLRILESRMRRNGW